MNKLYNQYRKSLRQLRDLEQDELLRSLTLFNIRIRLALDIEVDFKGKIALTKRKEVRETYILIIKLMELWNAYEALSHYVDEITGRVVKKVSKSRIYTQEFLKKVGSLETLSKALQKIKNSYESEGQFCHDFNQYIKRINRDKKLSKTLKNDAKSILDHANGYKRISGIEVLSLIYAERNMYYHNGETAKMEMRYSNRKKIIQYYRDALMAHTLMLATFVIDVQVEDSK